LYRPWPTSSPGALDPRQSGAGISVLSPLASRDIFALFSRPGPPLLTLGEYPTARPVLLPFIPYPPLRRSLTVAPRVPPRVDFVRDPSSGVFDLFPESCLPSPGNSLRSPFSLPPPKEKAQAQDCNRTCPPKSSSTLLKG